MKTWLCMWLALWLPAAALAETLVIPDSAEVIAAEAFAGSAAITEVVAPEGLLQIGEGAFRGCAALEKVSVPGLDTDIGEGAFEGCAEAMLLTTTPGSLAMQYAALNQIDYQADTTYRALLIGQNAYPDSIGALEAPARDVQRLRNALTRHEGTRYLVTVQQDLGREDMLDAIAATFADARAQDVSLLYYSGHGAQGGALVGVDGVGLSVDSLRSALDQIPGRKILLVDACYSGAIIGRSAGAGTAEEFVADFTSAFSLKTRDNLATDGYYVITAARSTQQSGEKGVSINGEWIYYGIFTRHVCDGLGYDYLSDAKGVVLADTNGDYVVTVEEMYEYARANAAAEYSRQTAQVYPDACTWQGLIRRK